MVWDSHFDPPASQRLTHPGVGPEVLDESYWSNIILHAGSMGDLGEYVVVSLVQKHSPTFVVFLRHEDGAVAGHYVHPGQFTSGDVLDVDGDGRFELVLTGQDNAAGLPAVVVLQPGAWTGSASTVQWNTSQVEHATRRALLPDWPEAREALHSERLEASIAPFVLWDGDRVAHRKHGLHAPDFAGWAERVQVIEGIVREDRDAPVGR